MDLNHPIAAGAVIAKHGCHAAPRRAPRSSAADPDPARQEPRKPRFDGTALRVLPMGEQTPDLEALIALLRDASPPWLRVLPGAEGAVAGDSVDVLIFDADPLIATRDTAAQTAAIEAWRRRWRANVLCIATAPNGDRTSRLTALPVDDVVFKPVSVAEALFRLRQCFLLHGGAAPASSAPGSTADAAAPAAPAPQSAPSAISVDARAKRVLVDGRAIHLTPKEFALLTLLASDPGRVFSKAEIIAAVWPGERGYGANDVHQCVRHLRAKIEPDAGHPRWVETVPGFGYRLRPGVLGN